MHQLFLGVVLWCMGAFLADGAPAVECLIWKHLCRALAPPSVKNRDARHGHIIQGFAVAVAPSMSNSENMSSKSI
jgi:hypothetical protein